MTGENSSEIRMVAFTMYKDDGKDTEEDGLVLNGP